MKQFLFFQLIFFPIITHRQATIVFVSGQTNANTSIGLIHNISLQIGPSSPPNKSCAIKFLFSDTCCIIDEPGKCFWHVAFCLILLCHSYHRRYSHPSHNDGNKIEYHFCLCIFFLFLVLQSQPQTNGFKGNLLSTICFVVVVL